MKKIVGLLFATICLTACNDGDLVFESLDFNDKEIQKCDDNELYFKINDKELLLVDFTDNSSGVPGSKLDTLADLNEMQTITTTNTTKIYYRTYDGAIAANAICSTLAPANPKVTAEYTSLNGGEILYTRTITPVVSDAAVNVNYTYTINFKNITLTNGTSEIKYTTLPYGSYVYDSSRMSFSFATNFNNCDSVLTGKTGTELIQITLPTGFNFPTTNQVQTINLNNTNVFRYYVFKEIFTSDDCEFPTETIKEDWLASNGSLQIETTVLTNTAGNVTGYKHDVKLIQAQFNTNQSTFTVSDRALGSYNITL